MKNEVKHTAHSSYRCEYHIVFAPKLSIPPYMSVAQFVGTLKSKSALMIFDRHADLKYKYGNRHFWARGYFRDTVGKNKRIIQEYIRDQLEKDGMEDQISLKEFTDRSRVKRVSKQKRTATLSGCS